MFRLCDKRHPLSDKSDNLTLICFSFARVKPYSRRPRQITYQLGSRTLHTATAVVGKAWSLLDLHWNGQAAVCFFHKTFSLLGVHVNRLVLRAHLPNY